MDQRVFRLGMVPQISVSIFLVSYQQKDYILEALNSALSQDCRSLEIVIADDGSIDGTREIIEARIKNYTGPHKIVLLPQEPNLGLVANMNRAMGACSGEVLVMCSGDDILKPNRASIAAREFELNSSLMAQFVNLEIIDSDSKVIRSYWSKIKERTIVGHRSYSRDLFAGLPFLVGAGGAYRRALLDYFGPLPESLEFEDSAWCIRALMLGDVLADPQIGVSWRWHGKNESIGGYSSFSGKIDSAIRFRKLARGYLQRYRFSQKTKNDIRLCIRSDKSNQKNLLNLNSLNTEEGLICRLKFHVTHPNARFKGFILSATKLIGSEDVRLSKKIKVLSKSVLKVISPRIVLYSLARFFGR
jgi:glycosyltransferase involved in cell wall biosynthesis